MNDSRQVILSNIADDVINFRARIGELTFQYLVEVIGVGATDTGHLMVAQVREAIARIPIGQESEAKKIPGAVGRAVMQSADFAKMKQACVAAAEDAILYDLDLLCRITTHLERLCELQVKNES